MNYRILFNIGVNAVCAIVFLVLFIISILTGGLKKRADRLFSITIGLLMINSVLGAFSYYLKDFSLKDSDLELALLTIEHIIFYVVCFFGLAYLMNYFELKTKARIAVYIVFAIIGVAFIIAIILNFKFQFYYSIQKGRIKRASYYPISMVYDMICFIGGLFGAVFAPKGSKLERVSFISFSAIPLLGTIVGIVLPDYSLFIISFLTAFLFHYAFYYSQRGRIIAEQKAELSDQQIRIMVSQIQPHFIYNCLSSISYLCSKDSKKAIKAIDDFSNYLRGNFSNLTESRLVPFSKELEHTKSYINLEKMRFEDRVNVEFDIKCDSFLVPSLCLQPIVENAVKHGICKKIEGGTVKISTREDIFYYYIEVKDDGLGFDTSKPREEDSRVHVGINNTKERIKKMCNGEIKVNSIIGVGTDIVISIPKDVNREGN